jgi:hypothetical protein
MQIIEKELRSCAGLALILNLTLDSQIIPDPPQEGC